MKVWSRNLWALASHSLACIIRNESAQQVLALSPDEQIFYFKYLAEINQSKESNEKNEIEAPWKPRSSFNLVHEFFQLPCSVATRYKRAEWFFDKGWQNKSILLLGDDDLVSTELSNREFSKVSVVDCDEKVLAKINEICASNIVKPQTFKGDLADPHFTPPSAADIVCLDPPYNFKWTLIFLNAAFRSVVKKGPSHIVLMLNPMCLKQEEFSIVKNFLMENGYHLKTHIRHFNHYPITGINRWLLWFGTAVFLRLKSNLARNHLYFGSDLFEFVRD
ncbi:MAG: bis-aminopropyl spermidine synthase family protein [Oligoflexus sp.]